MAEPVTLGSRQNEFLCTKALARHLNLSASWLEKARCRGEGPPYYRVGSKILYAVVEVDEWMASSRVIGGAHHG
ncbi:helix-turn-helix domain-containing protein [Maricaulis maris]|uniref:helix-turn-helix transcriptional regulator n=1 Tax=Maricaulis maris TaxID=74318 RepID=UPI0026F05237|nr:helix-turn-helix domain-containing protein [Maricaulis maris]